MDPLGTLVTLTVGVDPASTGAARIVPTPDGDRVVLTLDGSTRVSFCGTQDDLLHLLADLAATVYRAGIERVPA